MYKYLLRFSFSVSLIFQTTQAFSQESEKVFITVDSDVIQQQSKKFGKRFDVLSVEDSVALVRFDRDALPWLSLSMHRDFSRCGGFVLHEDISDAKKTLQGHGKRSWAKEVSFQSYEINNDQTVKQLIEAVQAEKIAQTIEKLSSYHNRYYTSDSGVESSRWIGATWAKLVEGRSDAHLEYYEHSAWPQPTPILTIEGKSDEDVFIGGLADSIAGFWRRSTSRAPGADDNASGIATITEVIRVLAENSHRPEKTLKFMGYAAEEVGLRGSKEIAEDYSARGIQVAGVLQLDMTNYAGSEWDIVFMSDYTNDEQNAFLGRLIDTYLPGVSWGYDQCGYACSDHASWHNQGYPASMPFEAKSRDKNPGIHSSRDTLERMGGNADHASKFARLALAFVAEL
jgi:leucyl aminopeptidase